jgi:ABC-type antimicrobial peptide transport system permease subunit
MALGARTGGVYALILSGGMKSVLVGIGIGLAAAVLSTRFIARLLFETSATDPVTLISVAALLASTALAASFFPARRAAKVDPMVALRCE